ncbi:hypothetical protein PSACC_01621 [Paramicrosporidium saccamoebae]|uniref:Uncharacterized protein n=1 Tax=Paramicrosporidium saccamoebae TaxID=1246581 RepID=A0A2H9TLE9_9FUNG|nr:hypothetical protein PSACC_01621 [Paramicrosporidium saccamoebae]
MHRLARSLVFLLSLLQVMDACRIGIVHGVPEYSSLTISSGFFMASLPNDPTNYAVITFKDQHLLECITKGNAHFKVLRNDDIVHSSFYQADSYFPVIPGDQVKVLLTTFPCDADRANHLFDTMYPEDGYDIFEFRIEALELPRFTIKEVVAQLSPKRHPKRDMVNEA